MRSVICTTCSEKIPFIDRTIATRIKEHVASRSHTFTKDRKPQTLIEDAFQSTSQQLIAQDQFNRLIARGLMAADIPLEKLGNPSFRQMLTNISGKKIPHSNTIRGTIVKEISSSVIDKIKKRIAGHEVYFIVDETTDPASRFCTNVMVGPLDGTKCKAMLVNVCFNDRNDNKTVQQAVVQTCQVLWPDKNVYDLLTLILSDQARYMLLAVSEIKKNSLMFPNVSHVTCLAHALSLVAKEIQKNYYLVDKYLADNKKFLLKSNKRKFDFKQQTGLTLPPIPVLTRWGTWMNAVAFHQTNYTAIRNFVVSYKPDSKSAAFESLKKIMSGQKLCKDLYDLRKYTGISNLIIGLEQHGVTMEKQLELVKECQDMLKDTPYEEKLVSALKKNPDLVSFTSQVLPDVRIKREFCPLVSVEVERSFSKFKSFLRSNRQRMTTDNIKHHMIVHYNNFL